MMRRALWTVVCAMLLTARPGSAVAFEVQVRNISTTNGTISAVIDVRDPLPDRFRRLLDEGGVLHLRVQAEFWESRPVWDRLVYPAIVRVFRLTIGGAGRDIAMIDPAGTVASYRAVPNPMPIAIEIGKSDRLSSAARYYLHVVATLGTLAEREAEDVGDAVFGRESEASGLGNLGRLVFRKMLEISDYLQSVSAETRSRRTAGQDILK